MLVIGCVVFVRPLYGLLFLIIAGAFGQLARFPELNWDVMDVVGALTVWSAGLYLLLNHRSFRISRLDPPVILLGITIIANLPRADEESLASAMRFLAILLVYLVAVQVLDGKRKVHLALMAVLAGGAVVAALTIGVFATGAEAFSFFGAEVQFSYQTEAGARLGGPFGQPNALAQVTALAVPIGLAMTLSSTGIRQWLWAALTGVSTLCTLLTQSRSAITGLMIGAAVVAFFARVRLRTALSAGLALFLFAYVLSTRATHQEHLLSRFDQLGVAAEFQSETGLSRLRIARAALSVFWENPMGTGFGTDLRVVGREMGLSRLSSHNVLLRFAVELGVPGLLAGIWLLFRQVRNLWEVASHGVDPLWRLLSAGCLGAVVCCWFHNMFHDTLHSGYVWLFFATASAVCLHGLQTLPAPEVRLAPRRLARA